MLFTGTDGQGNTVEYKDHKRYWYLLAFLSPAIYLASFWGYFAAGNNALFTLIPVIYMFGITPIVDHLVGEDSHNPPEAVMPAMMKDNFYRFSIYPLIAMTFVIFAVAVWFVGTQSLPWWSYIALVIGVGIYCGGVMTLTHELGHKSNKLDQFVAKFGNSVIGYGHFCIEHNRGHHVMVSTPEDPASARMGENIYRFAVREMSGTFERGIFHERERLAKKGYGFWTWRNDVLQSYALTLVIVAICVASFGPAILAFILPVYLMGWYTLTQANYIEHYGLLRAKKANGKYERTQPHQPLFRRFGIKSWTKKSWIGPAVTLPKSILTRRPKTAFTPNTGQGLSRRSSRLSCKFARRAGRVSCNPAADICLKPELAG